MLLDVKGLDCHYGRIQAISNIDINVDECSFEFGHHNFMHF